MSTISPKAFFPVIITEDVSSCRDFFATHFDFNCVFDEDWYCHMVHECGVQIAFLIVNHPTQPPALHAPFQGNGLVFSFEVEDADISYEALKTKGLNIVLELKTESWGQRHFMIQGPAGVIVDVIQNMDSSLDQ